jgi:O-antigen ligase/tetratricopeptide (TPR) repeat protein
MDYTKWLKWAIIGGLCLVPFVAFIVADGVHFPVNLFFPYITGKNFTFRIIVEILLALYVLLAVREPKYRPSASPLLWSMGAFVAWMAIATMFSVDPIKSFWSNFERMDGFITQLHLFAFFIIAGAVLTADKWWERFFQVSVAASMIQGLYALFQVLNWFGFTPSSQSGTRADTTFGNAIYLAVYMLFMFFITLFLLIRERKSVTARWLYGLALVLQLIGLYFTETRGALLGLVGGLVIAALYTAVFAKGPQWKHFRTYSLWGVGIVAVLIVGFLSIKNTSFVQHSNTLSRFASISFTDRTTTSRFMIWGEAWQGFKEKPLIGWGQENFSYVFNKYYDPGMFEQEQWFDRSHNAFVDWAIAGGAPALLLYVSFFALAAWALYRSELEVPEQAVFVGLLAGFAFNNLTVFDNVTSYIYFFLVLAFIHGLSKKKLPGWMFLSKPLGDKTLSVLAPITLVVLVCGAWALNGPGLARAQDLIIALTPTNLVTGAQRTPQEALASFKQVLGEGDLGYQEAVEQLFQLSSNTIAPAANISPEDKQQAFDLTKSAAAELIKQRPGDARIELFYAVFFGQFGQYKDAIEHLQEGLKDSPGKQQMLFQLGSTYIAQGDIQNALPPLELAFTEEPNYDLARTLYAAALYYAGQNAKADQILTEKFGSVFVDNQSLLQAYFSTKQYARLVKIYENRIAQNPADTQSLVGHAILNYFVTGNKGAAIAELQKVGALDASLAPQVQSFITQINNGTLKP